MQRTQLGQILVELGLVGEDQVRHFLALQESEKPRRPLGEILVEHGMIDRRMLRFLLNQQKHQVAIDPPVESSQFSSRPRPRSSWSEMTQRLGKGHLQDYLRLARDFGASDLCLSIGQPITVRLNGVIQHLPLAPLTMDSIARLVLFHLNNAQLKTFEEAGHADFALEFPEVGRIRLNLFRHHAGAGAVCRLVPDRIWPFEKLGLPDVVRSFAQLGHGLVLITGVTGSGKTTTLNSLIESINQNEAQHIITIEEPIEATIQSKQSFVSQREIPVHSKSFQQALRAALREDPDVIVIGEIRDPMTAATAISAAETGHLVFGTLHTRSAYRTVMRVLDLFPPDQREHVRTLLASTLRAVVCQQLVPWPDGAGQSLASEIMISNPAIANLIQKDRIFQVPSVMQTSREMGMILMDDSLLKLTREGRVSLDEAMSRATEKDKFFDLTKDPSWRKSISSCTA